MILLICGNNIFKIEEVKVLDHSFKDKVVTNLNELSQAILDLETRNIEDYTIVRTEEGWHITYMEVISC